MLSKIDPPVISSIYLGEKVYDVVCLAKVVLNVVVLGGYSEFDELAFGCKMAVESTL